MARLAANGGADIVAIGARRSENADGDDRGAEGQVPGKAAVATGQVPVCTRSSSLLVHFLVWVKGVIF